MKSFQLADKEDIQPVGSYTTYQMNHIMLPRAETIKPYVGTIEIPGIAMGTACLLNDGRILTCLHNIIDYEKLAQGKLELIDFAKQDIFAFFVKDDKFYQYKITDTYNTGLDKLKSYGVRAMCFDYAILGMDRNPVIDIGGGMIPDNTENFASAFAADPVKTLAVSGPFLTASSGGIRAHRYVSISNNAAAESPYYHIAQIGTHPTATGFSGQAMVSIENRRPVLYAIHSYRDNQGQQTGIKLSEIILSINDRPLGDANNLPDEGVLYTLQNWYEVLTKAKINMDGTVSRGQVIDFSEAVRILQRGGDIAGDNRPEVEAPSKKAWGGKPMRHDVHANSPRGLPHFHHPQHTANQHPGHAFYPGAKGSYSK